MKAFFHEGMNALDLWDICGSFGEAAGTVSASGNRAMLSANGLAVTTEVTEQVGGVFSRVTTVTNTTAQELICTELQDKFRLDGGEWDAYTQFNGWETESLGAWQSVETEILAESRGFRTNADAAPFAVVWSRQSNRGYAFHLIPDTAWELRIRRTSDGNENNHVEVCLGVNGHGLALRLAPGESFRLPEILYYTVTDRMSMDAWKLHRCLQNRYPRKHPMPVIYNTWLCYFDKLSVETVAKQVVPAAKLGAEYFVLDAGWFGKGTEWTGSRGDWSENMTGAFCGHMNKISELVRANGMKFGIWLELETADPRSDAAKAHPELFIQADGACLLDFAKPEAIDYVMEIVSGLIAKYQVAFFKFDFNSSLFFDARFGAFSEYMAGYNRFLTMLREKFPELYIERCASGGLRMNLADGRFCDTYWLSDDQNPQSGVRIFRDTVRRMPSQWIERWAVVRSLSKFEPTYVGHSDEKLLSTDDAINDDLRSVRQSFLQGFLTGGPIGFSCDLTKLSEAAFVELAQFIAEVKADRTFWEQAECRIIADGDTLLGVEYADSALDRIELVVFTFRLMQSTVTLYPAVQAGTDYRYNGETLSADALAEDGLQLQLPGRYSAMRVSLRKA